MILDLTDDEARLLSGAALLGLHVMGATNPGILANLYKYQERVRLTLTPDSAAYHVRETLAVKMRDATANLEPEVFTI